MGIDIERDTNNFLEMLKKSTKAKSYSYPNKLVVSGMGGSGIGGRIVESVAKYEDIGDILSWNSYGIPAGLSLEDNVICISYSGNTAETLSVAESAHAVGCKVEVITTGGKLGQLAETYGWDSTIIESGHQPRAALPLLLIPLLHKINFPDIEKIVELLWDKRK